MLSILLTRSQPGSWRNSLGHRQDRGYTDQQQCFKVFCKAQTKKVALGLPYQCITSITLLAGVPFSQNPKSQVNGGSHLWDQPMCRLLGHRRSEHCSVRSGDLQPHRRAGEAAGRHRPSTGSQTYHCMWVDTPTARLPGLPPPHDHACLTASRG